MLRHYLDHRWNAVSSNEGANNGLLVSGMQAKACLSIQWVLHCTQIFNVPLMTGFPTYLKMNECTLRSPSLLVKALLHVHPLQTAQVLWHRNSISYFMYISCPVVKDNILETETPFSLVALKKDPFYSGGSFIPQKSINILIQLLKKA